MAEPLKQIPGYVRCDRPHLNTEWRFEPLDAKFGTAIVAIQTTDGTVEVALHRELAADLAQKLQLLAAQLGKAHPTN